jgi:hypothetical protein
LRLQALHSCSDGIARIAESSGYDSEAAFTRAFKREFGVPPSVWRKKEGSGAAVRQPPRFNLRRSARSGGFAGLHRPHVRRGQRFAAERPVAALTSSITTRVT